MPHKLTFLSVSCIVSAAVLGFSCGQDLSSTREITETRTLTTPAEAPPATASSAERLGMVQQGAAAPASAQPKFTWTTPEGWKELPTSTMRTINLQPAGDPNSECYLTLLSGGGGGLAANVNRWRGQMGLSAIDDAAVAALPKKPFLGMDATYVELEGVYGGMGGQEQKPDYKMAGLLLAAGDMAIFLKMTGPKALIDQELSKFEAFCNSVAMAGPTHAHAEMPQTPAPAAGAAGALPENHPPINGAAPMTQPASSLTWTAPAGWTQSGARPMREVTFTMGADGKTECYIAKLTNRGGGLEPNINRWAGQMGLPALTSEAIAALPKITVLGKPCALVEFRGNYTDMSGASFEEYTMLGTMAEVGTDAIFVKLVGPATDVEAEKTNFVAFCESLK